MTQPLVTARLDLDAMRHEHVDVLIPLFADEHASPVCFHTYSPPPRKKAVMSGSSFTGPPSQQSRSNARIRIESVSLHKTREPFGTLQATLLEDASASIGYIIFPAHQRCGYAVEAMQAVCDHLRERHGVRRILADMVRGNLGSARVAEKLGMFEIPSANPDERAYAWRQR